MYATSRYTYSGIVVQNLTGKYMVCAPISNLDDVLYNFTIEAITIPGIATYSSGFTVYQEDHALLIEHTSIGSGVAGRRAKLTVQKTRKS